MKYHLMHKEVPVALVTLDSDTASITKVDDVLDAAHLPVGIDMSNELLGPKALKNWWAGRSIPASRQGLQRALAELDVFSQQLLIQKSLGLSLSDQYWIRPEGSGVKWSEVNFFENPFSEDVGNLLLGNKSPGTDIDFMSPDNTSDGWLKKKWTITGGRRCLIKGGSNLFRQEPYNEVIATAIMKRLGIAHVPYEFFCQDGEVYSICEDFIDCETELVTAWHIMQTARKPNHVSRYEHFLNCCDALGICGIRSELDKMLVLDFLIVNEDRHLNNFGLIRNADSLEWVGPAPVYDSGTSFFFATRDRAIDALDQKLPAKPFKTTHGQQIKLVQSFDWLDLSLLADIEDELRSIFSGSEDISEERCEVLCQALRRRIELISEVASEHSPCDYAGQDGDIIRDIAYSGSDLDGE